MSDPVAVPDIVGTYAEQVRLTLAQEPLKALTVPEICDAVALSERIVRMALDRLVFTREVAVTFRHVAHRRGSMPRQYKVTTPKQ